MAWVFWGFITSLSIESFIRIASSYKGEVTERAKRVQVSLPWYGWALAGYGIIKSKRGGKRK